MTTPTPDKAVDLLALADRLEAYNYQSPEKVDASGSEIAAMIGTMHEAAAALRDAHANHCTDCCCAQSWKAFPLLPEA